MNCQIGRRRRGAAVCLAGCQRWCLAAGTDPDRLLQSVAPVMHPIAGCQTGASRPARACGRQLSAGAVL